jgi:hypothetical protein
MFAVYLHARFHKQRFIIAMKPKAKEYLLTPLLVILRSGAIGLPSVVPDVGIGNGGIGQAQQSQLCTTC